MFKPTITRPAGKHRLKQLESLRAALQSKSAYSQHDSIALIEVGGLRPIRLNPVEVVVCEGDIAKIVETVAQVCGFDALVGVVAINALWQSKPVVLIPLLGGGIVLIEASARSQYPEPAKAVTAEEFRRMLIPLQQDIVAVTSKTMELRTENMELRRAKEALEQMKAKDLFRFAQSVDSDSFRFCAAVVVNGDVSKAAKALKMKDSTLRSRIDAWKHRGTAYQRLAEIVRWRKSTKGKMSDEDQTDIPRRSNTDYPDLLSELCESVILMNSSNWEEIVEELKEKIEAHESRESRDPSRS